MGNPHKPDPADLTVQAASPFRPRPWPIAVARRLLHRWRLAKIRFSMRTRLRHGDPIFIAKNVDVRAPHFFELGSFVSFGKNFTCEADLRVGSYVLISSNVSVVGKDHPFDDPSMTVFTQQRTDDSVVDIGSDVLIGFGSVIIGSVSIGNGCIVGAGSVVTRDLPPYTICAGVPARVIRHRFKR